MIENMCPPFHGIGVLVLRILLGVIFIPHGWMKIKNPSMVAGFFGQLGIPMPRLNVWVVALLESVGAVFLIIGLLTRLMALGFVIDMLVAIWTVKIKMTHSPFTSTQQAQGWEFELALLAGALALIFLGGGPLSLDALCGL